MNKYLNIRIPPNSPHKEKLLKHDLVNKSEEIVIVKAPQVTSPPILHTTSNINTTLVSQIWANRLATDKNLVIHWCNHYKKMQVGAFKINLNINGSVDDSEFFKKLLEENLNNVEIFINKTRSYDTVKRQFMNKYIQNSSSDCFFIPVDIDEFIDYNLETEIQRIKSGNYQATIGYLVDRVSRDKDGKINLKEVSLLEDIQLQYPLEENLNRTVKICSTSKVVLIRGGNKVKSGHHTFLNKNGKCIKSEITPTNIKVNHYTMTRGCEYKNANRIDKNRSWYENINTYIREQKSN